MGFSFRPWSAAGPGILFWFPAPLTWHVRRRRRARHSKCQTDKSFRRGQLLLLLLQIFLYVGLPGAFSGIFLICDRCDWNGAFRVAPQTALPALVTILLAEGLLLPASWHTGTRAAHAAPLRRGAGGKGAALGAGQGKAPGLAPPLTLARREGTTHLLATTPQLPRRSSGDGQLAKATCSSTPNACQ